MTAPGFDGLCVCCDKPGPHPYEDRHGDVWCSWCHDNGRCGLEEGAGHVPAADENGGPLDDGEPLDERVTFVVPGQVVTTTNSDGEVTEWSVGPTCAAKIGVWHCATHNETFPHDDLGQAKDAHLRTGYHVMAWLCLVDQRMEVPS